MLITAPTINYLIGERAKWLGQHEEHRQGFSKSTITDTDDKLVTVTSNTPHIVMDGDDSLKIGIPGIPKEALSVGLSDASDYLKVSTVAAEEGSGDAFKLRAEVKIKHGAEKKFGAVTYSDGMLTVELVNNQSEMRTVQL